MMLGEITQAMGWHGVYVHCACCADECRLTHYAPCVVDEHNEEAES